MSARRAASNAAMSRRLARRRVLALGALLVAASAGAEQRVAPASECAEAIARTVQAHYDAVTDLSAAFEQETRSPAGVTSRASGNVAFAKPGRMRWDYVTPAQSAVVSDGSTLWIWDPALGEAQKLAVSDGFLSGAAIQFLLGEGRLLESFEVRSEACDADPVWLELEPRQPAAYERLRLRARRETGEIVETGIVDLLGNEVRIAFRGVRTNRSLPAATFAFQPPPGTRVIEAPAAR
jgi:outer membrane lipoprotein carrier protein